MEFVAEVENAISILDGIGKAKKGQRRSTNALKTARRPKDNMSKEERKDLKEFEER